MTHELTFVDVTGLSEQQCVEIQKLLFGKSGRKCVEFAITLDRKTPEITQGDVVHTGDASAVEQYVQTGEQSHPYAVPNAVAYLAGAPLMSSNVHPMPALLDGQYQQHRMAVAQYPPYTFFPMQPFPSIRPPVYMAPFMAPRIIAAGFPVSNASAAGPTSPPFPSGFPIFIDPRFLSQHIPIQMPMTDDRQFHAPIVGDASPNVAESRQFAAPISTENGSVNHPIHVQMDGEGMLENNGRLPADDQNSSPASTFEPPITSVSVRLETADHSMGHTGGGGGQPSLGSPSDVQELNENAPATVEVAPPSGSDREVAKESSKAETVQQPEKPKSWASLFKGTQCVTPKSGFMI